MTETKINAKLVQITEHRVKQQEAVLLKTICAVGLGHLIGNTLTSAPQVQGHFQIFSDGTERFLLKGEPILEFGPITFQTVPTMCGVDIRVYRDIKRLK